MRDLEDKIETYGQMLKLDRRSRVFALLAEELCAAGKWEEAAEICRKGLLFHPDHLRSRALLGWALMEMGDAERSERILLKASEDIRKNSVIFKLLSELAAESGNTESAKRYAGIYQVFQAAAAAPAKVEMGAEPDAGPLMPESAESADLEPPDVEAFKAEAIEELQGVDMETSAPEYVEEPPPGPGPKPSELEEVLIRLAQRIEARFSERIEPPAILSEEDKIMLERKIVTALSA
jgi:tetratricopeptide (TPR) repeat protein